MVIDIKKINWRSPGMILVAIMALALALRLWVIWLLPCYSFDEMVSTSVAVKPLGQIWSYVRWEMHPPLHFYYLHAWFVVFGAGEWSARFSSLLLSLISILVIYILAKEIFKSRPAGLFAAFLYSISAIFAFYGIWARMYEMLFLFSALSYLFFWRQK